MATETGIYISPQGFITRMKYYGETSDRTPKTSSSVFILDGVTYTSYADYVTANTYGLDSNIYYFYTDNTNLRAKVYVLTRTSTSSAVEYKGEQTTEITQYYDDDMEALSVSVPSTRVRSYLFVISENAYNVSIGTLTNCTCNYANGDSVDKTSNIIITAETGYIFDDSSYQYKLGDSYKYFTISDDKKTLTIDTSNVTNNITIGNITATLDTSVTYTVTFGTLTNCTCNYSNGGVITDDTNIVITANTGYYFNSDSYSYTEGSTSKNFVVSSLKNTLTIDTSSISGNIVIGDITADEETATYTISFGTLTNCTANYNNGDVIDKTKNLVVTANSGYAFNTLSTYSYYIGSTLFNFTIASDGSTLTAYLQNINDNITVNDITAESTAGAGVVNITGTISNAVCNYVDGEVPSSSKTLYITPNDGYEFTGVYTYELNGATETFGVDTSGRLYIEILESTVDATYDLNGTYIATVAPNYSEFVKIYKVTNTILTSLASKKYTEENVDMSSQIYNLYSVNLPVPTDLIGDDTQIVLGNLSSGVLAPLILNDSYTVDLGNIKIPRTYNNAYDFLNTSIDLHIPYSEAIQLDVDYYMDTTIHMEMKINLYEGVGVLRITNENGYTYQATVELSTLIPFIQWSTKTSYSKPQNNFYIEYPKAYIEINRKKPYQTTNIFGRECEEHCVLNSLSGYCKIDSIELNTNATKQENDMIVSLVKEGVFL